MSSEWIPKERIDPALHGSETLTPVPLSTLWGGTGVSAANLAALKSYLGISGASVGAGIKPLRRLQVVDPSSAAGFDRIGLPAPTILTPGGAISRVVFATGSYIRLTDDSSVPSPASITIPQDVQRRWNPDITFVFKPQVTIASPYGRLWVGLSSTALAPYDDLSTLVGAQYAAAFRFHGNLDTGTGTFKCFTVDGTSQQQVQGTVPFINDGFNAVRIRHTGGGTWEFSVYNSTTGDWTVEASITAAIGTSDVMQPYIGLVRMGAVGGNKTLEVKMVDLQMS